MADDILQLNLELATLQKFIEERDNLFVVVEDVHSTGHYKTEVEGDDYKYVVLMKDTQVRVVPEVIRVKQGGPAVKQESVKIGENL